MPPVSHANQQDSVFSPTGSGYKCLSPVTTSTGAATQSRVFADGKLVCHGGDVITPHAIGGCGLDSQSLSSVSSRVFAAGAGIGRIGDLYGDNSIISGSSRVFAG